MKRIIGTLASLVFISSVFAQNNPLDSKPKGMEFIPAGSFEMKLPWISETKMTKVSVDAFWMSNEITNAEYREFVVWAKNNPDKKLNQMKYSVVVFSDPKNGRTKDTVIAQITPIEVSSFKSEMIDPICLEKANPEYKDYFNNKKYDDYPVVGVSFKLAQYFCLWKTMLEDEKMKEKGLPDVHFYRIPLETEWEYVAQQASKTKGNTSLPVKIQKVNEGSKNEWDISHLDDNVSEWVTTNKNETGIIRGGSWKSGSSISERQLKDPNSWESFVGFRIVQSYVQPRDNKNIK